VRTKRPLAAALLLAASASLSCGGGGGEDSPLWTDTYASLASFDGFITWPGVVTAGGEAVAIGDDADDAWTYGCYRFVHPGLPSGARVWAAALRVYQFAVVGSPYPTLGGVHVAHVDLGFGLDAGDMTGALAADVGVISTDATLGYKDLDVTAQVKADLAAGRKSSDFRLTFYLGTDGDSAPDLARFTDAEDLQGIGHPPELVVTWN
jgi:hypothetical protein